MAIGDVPTSQEVHILMADSSGEALAEGTFEQCEFTLHAFLRYGIPEHKLLIVPKSYYEENIGPVNLKNPYLR